MSHGKASPELDEELLRQEKATELREPQRHHSASDEDAEIIETSSPISTAHSILEPNARRTSHPDTAMTPREDQSALLEEKDNTISELRETIQILEMKVQKLEQLVRLKDGKIQTLAAKLKSQKP